MKLLFDEDLVEAVVFACASGQRQGIPSLQIRRFQREREGLYAILDPDERNAAFFRLHLSWFREWGMEKLLADAVSMFPMLSRELDVMAFRKARGRSEEAAELYVNATAERHGVIALRPERFQRDAALAGFLNHELMHLSDMVDPTFDYSPDIYKAGQTASEQRLIRERYRLLWDITIDGRLVRSGRQTIASLEQRRTEFECAYRFLPDDKRATTFASLWFNLHAPLMLLASDPRDLNSLDQQVPGAPCPLCGFATFDWTEPKELKGETVSAIQTQFPGWTARVGACTRCIEMYEAAAGFELPATICL